MGAVQTPQGRFSSEPSISPLFFPSVFIGCNDFSSSLLTLSSAKAVYTEIVLKCMFEQGKLHNNENLEEITGHYNADFNPYTKWQKIVEAKIIMLFPWIRIYVPKIIVWTTTIFTFNRYLKVYSNLIINSRYIDHVKTN